MVIYKSDGTPIISLDVDDTSYRFREIQGDNLVQLEFALTQHVELPVGAYIVFQGEQYDLLEPQAVKIQHSRDFEYKAVFEGAGGRFRRHRIHNLVDGRLKFDLIARPEEHLALVVGNLCERYGSGTWTIGTCISSVEKLVSYNHTTIQAGLAEIARVFGTEVEVIGRAISLRKVEYNFPKDGGTPLSLAYGKNGGFEPGVGRTNYGDTLAVGRLFIQGGSRNISVKEYGASTLHLPRNLSFNFDGAKFEGETGYNSARAVAMVTDALGYSVALASADSTANEDSLDLSEVYPKRVGTVSGVHFVYRGNYYETLTALQTAFPSLSDDDWEDVQVDISDSGIPNALNFAACLMENGEPLTVIFQSGNLSGREFDATFRKSASSPRPANRFELVKSGIDGVNMPTKNFLPAIGDTYAVFNVWLPSAYISDAQTFSGAEYDALREAAKYLYENKDTRFTFSGNLDRLYARRNWLNINGKLVLGGCVSFTHPDVQPTAVLTRIVAIKEYINNPYSPELTLSNETVNVGAAGRIASLEMESAHVDAQVSEQRQFTKRSFRDAKETIALLQAAFDNFSGGINPVTVETMAMLVGDQSLQYRFCVDRSCAQVLSMPVTYTDGTHTLAVPACALQHMTLGISAIVPSGGRTVDNYKRWNMSAFSSGIPYGYDASGNNLGEKSYYLYAKVDKLNDGTNHLTGEFVLSENPIKMEAVSGYYHFLVGILNSEFDGTRSFVPMYGYTEILPGQIYTDILRSGDGSAYFDLLNKAFKLGEKLKYNVGGSGDLVLNGALVQTGSGANVPLGADCGEYDPDRVYSWGNRVWKADANGTRSTYVYINATAKKGQPVTDTNYWDVAAAGVKGATGNGISSITEEYASSTNGNTPPSSWSSTKPSAQAGYFLWTKTTTTFTNGGTPHVTYSAVYCAANGTNGQNGQTGPQGPRGYTGPASPYRGNYDGNENYSATSKRCDVVYYPSTAKWYQALYNGTDRVFSGKIPTNTSYWSEFGANFSNVATGLLFAARAVIDNLAVRELETDAAGNKRIVAEGDTLSAFDASGNEKLRITGSNLSAVTPNQSETLNAAYPISSGTVYNLDLRSGLQVSGNSTLKTVTASNGATLNLPQTQLTLELHAIRIQGGSSAYVLFEYGWLIDGVRKTAETIYGEITSSNGSFHETVNIEEYKAPLSAGEHTIAVWVELVAYGDIYSEEGAYYASFSAVSFVISYSIQKTEIAADGFRVAAGNYGLQVTSSGIKKMTDGVNWVSL